MLDEGTVKKRGEDLIKWILNDKNITVNVPVSGVPVDGDTSCGGAPQPPCDFVQFGSYKLLESSESSRLLGGTLGNVNCHITLANQSNTIQTYYTSLDGTSLVDNSTPLVGSSPTQETKWDKIVPETNWPQGATTETCFNDITQFKLFISFKILNLQFYRDVGNIKFGLGVYNTLTGSYKHLTLPSEEGEINIPPGTSYNATYHPEIPSDFEIEVNRWIPGPDHPTANPEDKIDPRQTSGNIMCLEVYTTLNACPCDSVDLFVSNIMSTHTEPYYAGNCNFNTNDTPTSDSLYVSLDPRNTDCTIKAIEWYSSNDNTSWAPIAGATSSSYDASNNTKNYYQAHAILTNNSCSSIKVSNLFSNICQPITSWLGPAIQFNGPTDGFNITMTVTATSGGASRSVRVTDRTTWGGTIVDGYNSEGGSTAGLTGLSIDLSIYCIGAFAGKCKVEYYMNCKKTWKIIIAEFTVFTGANTVTKSTNICPSLVGVSSSSATTGFLGGLIPIRVTAWLL